MSIDVSKFKKAIAGGVAAAIGGSGTAYVILPPGLDIPAWIYAVVPIANFIVGFVIVYESPANVPSP